MDSFTHLGKWFLGAAIFALGLSHNPLDETRAASIGDQIKERIARTEKFVKAHNAQLNCLALNAYYEARGEGREGMAAVTRVVLNRVAHGFASTPCNVVYQRTVRGTTTVCQFSWTCERHAQPHKDNPQFRIAEQIAYAALVHDEYSNLVSDNTLYFHSVHVRPGWKLKRERVIGNHIFYRGERDI